MDQPPTELPGTELPGTLPLPDARSPRAPAPDALGRHAITETLGAGGMGVVLGVHDPDLDRDVAAKMLREPASPTQVAKFVREARITGGLDHPGVVPVHELGRTADGRLYFTMKRIGGVTLADLLEARPRRPLAELLAVFVKICEAIAFAHARRVIHRDLKPANVMTGEYGEVYVCDWGLAKRLDEPTEIRDGDGPDTLRAVAAPAAGSVPVTQDGSIVGTPAYMAPEQADGRIRALDERTDVYALGAILHHVLTGLPPFEGATTWAIIAQVTEGAVTPSRRAGRDPAEPIPWELEAIAMRAMALDPAARYPTAIALKRDVEAFLAGRLVEAARYSWWTAAQKLLRRHPAVVRGAAAVVLALASVYGVRAWNVRVQVARAWAAIDLARLDLTLAAARDVPLDPDPAQRPVPSLGELERTGDLIEELQAASDALGEVARLAPRDTTARARWFEVLAHIGRLALVRHDDAFAAAVYRQAATLGVDDDGARARAEHARRSPTSRLAARARTVDAHLARAGKGELDLEGPYRAAVIEIASLRDRATVEALIAVVADATRRLDQGTVAGLLEASAPTPEELTRGEGAILGLDAIAHDRCLHPTAPVPAELAPRWNAALARLERRREVGSRVRYATILAEHQDRELSAGGVDRARTVELASDALGLIGDPRGAVEALTRLLHAEWDERRALAPALALVRLSRADAAAREALLASVGMGATVGLARMSPESGYWRQVAQALARERDSAGDLASGSSSAALAAPATVPELCRRARALVATGDTAGAIAACALALELDPACGPAFATRGAARAAVGDHAGAAEDLGRALELDATDAMLWWRRAAVWRALGNASRAQADLDRALELSPELAVARVDRAHVMRAAGKLDGALADLDRAIAADPSLALAYSARGLVHLERGDKGRALADLDRAVELDGRSAEAYLNRGLARGKLSRLAEAVDDLNRAIELGARTAHAYATRATVRFGLGAIERALEDLERAIALEPRNAILWCERANAERARGWIDRARADVDHALVLDARCAYAYNLRGSMRVAAGDPDGAMADYRRAVECDPRLVIAHNNIGALRLRLGNAAGAVEAFTNALALEPLDATTLGNRGLAYRALGQDGLALADQTRAIELEPNAADPWFERGTTHLAMGQRDLALADLGRAIELDPRHARALARRGRAHLEAGDLDRALADLDRAIGLDPRLGEAYTTRAKVKFLRGGLSGFTDLDKAVEVAPDDPLPWCNRGDARWTMGDLKGALADFERAVACAPPFAPAFLGRGNVRVKQGELALAVADYERALELDPTLWSARVNLGNTLAKLGRNDDAVRELERARPTAPPNAQSEIDAVLRMLRGR